ncbi:MAG: hypothetical protein JWN79_721, partial [Gemmatimonadetes bacterium]|nr:hypothetical protein [Gemmatimonadota bacterium]
MPRRALLARTLAVGVLLALTACRDASARARETGGQQGSITIAAVMIDPTTVPDEQGEWLALHNDAPRPVRLAGWSLASAHDRGFVIPAGVTIPARGTITLARNPDPATNGGVRAALGYTGLAFANGADWLALRDATGATRDSVAWERAPRGVPLQAHSPSAAGSGATPPPARMD